MVMALLCSVVDCNRIDGRQDMAAMTEVPGELHAASAASGGASGGPISYAASLRTGRSPGS